MRSLILAALLAPLAATAAPTQFVLQGRLLDVQGVPVQGTQTLTVTLYQANGTGVWERDFTQTPFDDGFFTVTLDTDGDGVTLEQVMRSATPAVEIGFGVNAITASSTRQPFHSVPRAAVAEAVPVASGLSGQACTGVGAVAFDTQRNGIVVCGTGGTWSDVGGCPDGTLVLDGVCAPCGADAISQAGPLYFWPLDDGGSVALDATGRKNLSYLGSVSRSSSTPVFGSQGITFPGDTTSRLQGSSFSPPVGDSTVMGWVKTTTDDAGIVSYATSANSNAWLPLYRPADLTYLVNDLSEPSGVVVDDGQWHHIAMSRVESTGVVTVYVDGQSAGSLSVAAGTSPSGGGTLVFGQEQDSVGGGFDANQALNGELDDIAMFASALDGAAIQRLYRLQRCE